MPRSSATSWAWSRLLAARPVGHAVAVDAIAAQCSGGQVSGNRAVHPSRQTDDDAAEPAAALDLIRRKASNHRVVSSRFSSMSAARGHLASVDDAAVPPHQQSSVVDRGINWRANTAIVSHQAGGERRAPPRDPRVIGVDLGEDHRLLQQRSLGDQVAIRPVHRGDAREPAAPSNPRRSVRATKHPCSRSQEAAYLAPLGHVLGRRPCEILQGGAGDEDVSAPCRAAMVPQMECQASSRSEWPFGWSIVAVDRVSTSHIAVLVAHTGAR